MDKPSISLVISKCNFTHNSGIDKAVNEQRDKDKFHPDGINVAYVKSNYCQLYHSDYSYLEQKGEIVVKTSTKGRKRKIVEQKHTKRVYGERKEFTSMIAFGVIHETMIYDIKVFCHNSINISGLKVVDKQFIIMLIQRLLDYINIVDPNLQLAISGEPEIILCNMKAKYELPLGHSFNLYRLKQLHTERYVDIDIWKATKVIFPYNNEKAYYSMYLRADNERIIKIKFYSDGKLTLYGGQFADQCIHVINTFLDILRKNSEYLIQVGSVARKKSEVL
jgi:hypothetical protein